jgi:hypothetical protein
MSVAALSICEATVEGVISSVFISILVDILSSICREILLFVSGV